MALQGFLRTAVINFGGIVFLGGAYRFTRFLLMSLDFIPACSWLLHDNKSRRSCIPKNHSYAVSSALLSPKDSRSLLATSTKAML